MTYTDVLYDKKDGVAWITINRPDVRNAFHTRTVHELADAFEDARHDPDVGVVVLTGAGDKAFCSGGDQKDRGAGGYSQDGQRPMNVDRLHSAIRHCPKPVIAMVNGFAIGGGHVLHVLCDLSIAADTAIFGQTGPRVGSVDAGHGTGYLPRVVREKKARETWYLCRQYSAQDALGMGLVNKVVPARDLRADVEQWCRELLDESPTATVRGILQGAAWQPYTRAGRADTLLSEHTTYLQGRAPQVQYSARILFQELRQSRGYRGSYETVKRVVRPLRDVEQAAARATVRFETPPGQQSQIDWGQARSAYRSQPVTLHVFILTLGYSRRSFHEPCLGETLSQFLDAHERAFEYFGGHTRAHLYDRPRTVCQPGGDGRGVWNATFKQFADYWGFEPHLCRAYRAQTKANQE